MPSRKPLLRLTLLLACAAAILWLGVGCGEDVDPYYPCGQEALRHAIHVREVSKQNRALFRRQPGFHSAIEHFIRNEEGNWSDEYGIVIRVQEKVDQDTLPPEDRIPDELEGIHVYIDEWPPNHTGGLIEGVFNKNPEFQYAAAVMWKNEDLFLSQPNLSSQVGYGPLGNGGRAGEPWSVKVSMLVTDRVDESTQPRKDRIPECLDGVPILIFESKSN